MKIENDKHLSQEECDSVNEYHNELGFDFVIKPENTCKTLVYVRFQNCG